MQQPLISILSGFLPVCADAFHTKQSLSPLLFLRPWILLSFQHSSIKYRFETFASFGSLCDLMYCFLCTGVGRSQKADLVMIFTISWDQFLAPNRCLLTAGMKPVSRGPGRCKACPRPALRTPVCASLSRASTSALLFSARCSSPSPITQSRTTLS